MGKNAQSGKNNSPDVTPSQDREKKDTKKESDSKNAEGGADQEKIAVNETDQSLQFKAESTLNETINKAEMDQNLQNISLGETIGDMDISPNPTPGKATERHSMAPVITPSTSYPQTPTPLVDKQAQNEKQKARASEVTAYRMYKIDEEAELGEQQDKNVQETVHEFPDGSRFEGQMKIFYQAKKRKLIQHGNGKQTQPNGNVFEGKWRNGIISEGTLSYPDGSMYTGEFNELAPSGYGELTKKDGSTFKGMWEKGEITKGTEIKQNGEIYRGEFKDSKSHGQGEYVYQNKNVYKGQWEFGEIKGQGELYSPNGTLLEGKQKDMKAGGKKGAAIVTKGGDDRKYIGSTDLNGNEGKLKFDGVTQDIEAIDDIEKKRMQEMHEKLRDTNEMPTSQGNDHFDGKLRRQEEELDQIRQKLGNKTEFRDIIGSNMHVSYRGPIQNGIIANHNETYAKNVRRLKRDHENDKWSFTTLAKSLQDEPIYATKYNHNLEGSIMNHYQVECKIVLSRDGKTLEITNRKLNTRPEYRYEITPDDIRNERKAQEEAKKHGQTYQPKIDVVNDDHNWMPSSASCNLSDIQAIIYGGQSSRFWIYRKHMISLDSYNVILDEEIPNYNPKYKNGFPENLPKKTSYPFFAWQCITLQFETRNLDFVIKDEKQMDRFIKFLVQGMNSIDGRNGTADLYIDSATHYAIKREEKRINRKVQKKRDSIPLEEDEEYEDWLQLKTLNEDERNKIREQQAKEIYRQTNFKYLLMRIRTKIGYFAFRKQMTVNELILNVIARTYKDLTQAGEIPQFPYSERSLDLFEELLDSPMKNTIDGLMEMAHDDVIKKRKEQLYKFKEMKLLGIRSMDELNPAHRRGLQLLYYKNLGETQITYDKDLDSDEETMKEIQEKIETRELVQTGRSYNKKDIANYLFNFVDKSKCSDMYLRTKIDMDKKGLNKINMYEQRSYRVLLKYKFKRKAIENRINKIQFLIGAGELVDVFYLRAVLLKKSLAKQMFVLDLEHSQEVYIPDVLSCDMYPYSFRYYDPIISITNRLFSNQQKLYHCLKTDFYLKKLQGKDFKKKFLERTGVLPNMKKYPQQFSHAQMKELNYRNIKISQTKHAISLQKSRYLMVESTEQGLKKLADLQTYVIEKKKETEPQERRIKPLEDEQLELRFCHGQEVNDKRQKFIIFKQKQFVRHDHLKNNGQKLYTTWLIDKHIRENIDELYKNRPRNGKISYNKEKGHEKDLDLIPFRKLTGRQKNMLQRDKKAYQDWLFRKAEYEVQKRRFRIREKTVEECYEQCDAKRPFISKNNYIEAKIESTFDYFTYLDDFSHLGTENIERTRKKSRAVEKEIQKLRAKRLAALDPVVIDQMSEKNLKYYIAHKGYQTDLKQLSLKTLLNIFDEQQQRKDDVRQERIRKQSLYLNEPIKEDDMDLHHPIDSNEGGGQNKDDGMSVDESYRHSVNPLAQESP